MARDHRNTRLYMPQSLSEGTQIPLARDRSHYLLTVLRLTQGDTVAVFNATDGEWKSCLVQTGKRACRLDVVGRMRPPEPETGPWLLQALIKKHRFEMVIEKATELGVAAIQPVTTQFTDVGALKMDRHRAQMIEAAEQCGRLSVPDLFPVLSLADALSRWPHDRTLYWADERTLMSSPVVGDGLPTRHGEPGVLIGPEGGFSSEERRMLETHEAVRPLSLGPRILRAETAAIAALVIVQTGQAGF